MFQASKQIFQISIIAILMLVSVSLNGQETCILGIVVDSLSKDPLYPANVIIKDQATLNYLFGTITSKKGEFEFFSLEPGKYIVVISYVGYLTQNYSLTLTGNEKKDLGAISLAVLPVKLSEIEIVYKPLIEYDDDGNVTLNIDMMGDVANMSVADAIQSVPGLYFDFDGGLHFSGYTSFETLINGKRLGSNIRVSNPGGNSMYIKLKQIPAKFIKTVEILPEPRGKYGMFTPVINMIANGDLRDYYDANTELGIKNKYGVSAGMSKIFKKLTLTGSLGYNDLINYTDREEYRTYNSKPELSYSQISSAQVSKNEGEFQFSSNYDFDLGHKLNFSFNKKNSRSVNIFQRMLDYQGGEKSDYKETRKNEPESSQFDLKYRRRFYVGEKRSLRLTANASVNNSRNAGSKTDYDKQLNQVIKQNRSMLQNNQEQISLNLQYYNAKPKIKYGITGDMQISHANENAWREQKLENGDWERLSNYENDVTYQRYLPKLTLNCFYRFSKDNKQLNKSIRLSVSETFVREVLNNHLLGEKKVDNHSRTSFNTFYIQSFNGYGSFEVNGNGAIRWPSLSELLASPVYVDEKNIIQGNPELKPEVSYKGGVTLSWNPSGVMRISFGSSGEKPPNAGFTMDLDYSTANNKIVNSWSLSEEGIMVQSFSNSTKYRAILARGSFHWNPFSWSSLESGVNYSADGYSQNAQGNSYNGSWILNSELKFKKNNNITLSIKYRYNSSRIGYSQKTFGFHDGSVSLSGLAFKSKVFLSLEAVNLLQPGRMVEIYGDGFTTKTINFRESPIIWFNASFKFFKFLKK